MDTSPHGQQRCVRQENGRSPEHSEVWRYNDRNELTGSTRRLGTTVGSGDPVPADDRGYEYDPIGNRESYDRGEEDRLYYCANQLNQYEHTAATSQPCSTQPVEVFEHDEDGNLIEVPNGDAAIAPGDQVKYEWDAENRLIRVLPEAATPTNGDKKVEYTYDYMNRRVERKMYEYSGSSWGSPIEHTRYVYHGWNVILELDALDSNAILKKYTWGLDLAGQNGQVNSLDAAGGIGGLLACLDTAGTASTGDDRTFVYSYDANGNVCQLVETTTGGNYGTLAAAYEYDAYGNTIVASFNYASANLIRFSTRPIDPLTLLGHWPMRVLDLERGRWGSRDPMTNLLSTRRPYEYASNRPTRRVDPVGGQDLDSDSMPTPVWGDADPDTNYQPCDAQTSACMPTPYGGPETQATCLCCLRATQAEVTRAIAADLVTLLRRGYRRATQRDALQHCIGACHFAKVCGRRCTTWAGSWLESVQCMQGPGECDRYDSWRDLHNNLMGSRCDQSDCVACCEAALRRGQLHTAPAFCDDEALFDFSTRDSPFTRPTGPWAPLR